MKYTQDLCKKYGIHISYINSEKYEYLKIEHDDDFNMVEGCIQPYIYFLSSVDVKDLKNDFQMYSYIIDNIIDKHLTKYIKNTRKRKLEALDEI